MVKGLALLRIPLAYTAMERVIDILKLSSFDPIFVNEAASSFGILAKSAGKGKGRASHLTVKVSRRCARYFC